MNWDLPADTSLAELAEEWLSDIESTIDPETADLYRLHMNTHLIPHFKTAHEIQPAAVAAYGRSRLRVVKRTTVQKERSTLRGFLFWCEEQKLLSSLPDFPTLPKRATGTAWHQRRRGVATDLSPEECHELIEKLPQWSRPRGNAGSYPIRARFIVAYETSLRPATLDALSVPEHYSRGAPTLRITDAIDKARFGRDLPLTPAARAALDSAVHGPGLIFGDHDYRYPLTKAAKAVLPAHKARTFTAYDLRHARLTELAEGGNLTGTAFAAGHRRVTTTALYVKPGFRAAERALGLADSSRDSRPQRLVRNGNLKEYKALCEGEDSNLHGSYPASTSSHPDSGMTLTLSCKHTHINDLRSEAVALLGVAADGTPVPEERIRSFARAVIELTPVTRLALSVLDGGPYAPRRALELAQTVAGGLVASPAPLTGEEGG
jgi:integrase